VALSYLGISSAIPGNYSQTATQQPALGIQHYSVTQASVLD